MGAKIYRSGTRLFVRSSSASAAAPLTGGGRLKRWRSPLCGGPTAAIASVLVVLLPVAVLSGEPSGLPSRKLTPGARNPGVTEENIARTICNPNFSQQIRVSGSYQARVKEKLIGEYGYTNKEPKAYQLDALIPLELGGMPTDPRNLWPQPIAGAFSAKEKHRLENVLHRRVCSGAMTLEDAQREISENWIDAYRKYLK